MSETFSRQKLLAELLVDEGERLHVYDDANGLAIHPGSLVVGHPTIGIGRALDVHGISGEESDYLVNNDISALAVALTGKLPFFAGLNDARQRVLLNIAFNTGVGGLLKFSDLLAALTVGDTARAAEAVLQSKLAPARAARLHDLLLLS